MTCSRLGLFVASENCFLWEAALLPTDVLGFVASNVGGSLAADFEVVCREQCSLLHRLILLLPS